MYLKLFLSFAYIGLFTFGGGIAMLPMFQRELVEKNKWLTEKEMVDLFSIGQCLPGIIAANTAIFVGYKTKGFWGGIVAALGVILPSVTIVLIVAMLITNLADYPIVQRAFAGLRVCVSVLIINAVLKLRKHSIVDWTSALICMIVFVLAVFAFLPIPILIITAGICGMIISSLRKCKAPEEGGPE
ncbi:MAG: chromate transporter [Oscillospiraceae bacterium]|nr:chromate transporter [Oscillospiraceae bacterium]